MSGIGADPMPVESSSPKAPSKSKLASVLGLALVNGSAAGTSLGCWFKLSKSMGGDGSGMSEGSSWAVSVTSGKTSGELTRSLLRAPGGGEERVLGLVTRTRNKINHNAQSQRAHALTKIVEHFCILQI